MRGTNCYGATLSSPPPPYLLSMVASFSTSGACCIPSCQWNHISSASSTNGQIRCLPSPLPSLLLLPSSAAMPLPCLPAFTCTHMPYVCSTVQEGLLPCFPRRRVPGGNLAALWGFPGHGSGVPSVWHLFFFLLFSRAPCVFSLRAVNST